ncbi:transposase [Aeromonas media]|uniref:transposase n=1 Tax=Aeromonas media TaxID=651 RepID=UPI001F001835|nr:transposase [Aeromonas media]
MTIARSRQISLADTPYYHVVSRCVRRAFLCGQDAHSGQSYEHRRQWVADKLGQLSQVFAIGICAYAVMSNHYHLVLKVQANIAHEWSEREVAERWSRLFQWPLLVRRWYQGEELIAPELDVVQQLIAQWRERLHSISWLVRLLNESLARQANQEDGCKGHFWEGRFKSQALLTESALLACMTYVDLNPIRAGIATTPEESDFTSNQVGVQMREFCAPADRPVAGAPPFHQLAGALAERVAGPPGQSGRWLQGPLLGGALQKPGSAHRIGAAGLHDLCRPQSHSGSKAGTPT